MFEHFLSAQDPVYEIVLDELGAGDKQSHWMWFIFSQLKALAKSPTALQFGLNDLDDARVYAAHPILGARLRECVKSVQDVEGRTAREIFGAPDDLKFCSCLTLFAHATGETLFKIALEKYYDGGEDPLTLRALGLN